MSDAGRALLRLFLRPEERNHLPKDPPENAPSLVRSIAARTSNRSEGSDAVPVEVGLTSKFPDFSFSCRLSRDEHFSVFIPRHSEMAAKLIEMFMDFETDQDLLSGAIFARDRVNPDMFIYALSVAILHRPNTQIPEIPPLVQFYPQKFLHNRVIREAKKESGLAPVPDSVLVISKDFSASDFDVEHRLAYFREDLGMNVHHWRWHLVYPISGPNAVTEKDRRPFTYRIKVENESDVERIGTLRIFVAPNTDENGNPFKLAKQRLLMVEMDKFTEILPPGGRVIERKSSQASVTIPFERTFPKVGDQRSADSVHCGCGWPHHMLLPKGNVRGLSATLFVMVSDFEVDKVHQGDDTGYKTASSYCGLKDKKYPDARAMGYPFDRPLRDGADDLATFKTSNMSSIDVEIVFYDGSTKSA